MAALQSFFAGLVLSTIVQKDRQLFEYKLQMVQMTGIKNIEGDR